MISDATKRLNENRGSDSNTARQLDDAEMVRYEENDEGASYKSGYSCDNQENCKPDDGIVVSYGSSPEEDESEKQDENPDEGSIENNSGDIVEDPVPSEVAEVVHHWQNETSNLQPKKRYKRSLFGKSKSSRAAFFCPFCQVTFCSNFSLVRHLVQIHDAGMGTSKKTSRSAKRSETSGTKSNNRPSATEEVQPDNRDIESSDKYHCSICNIYFDRLHQLGKHMLSNHGQDSQFADTSHKSDIRGTQSSLQKEDSGTKDAGTSVDEASLDSELAERQKAYPCRCPCCNSKFGDVNTLINHVSQVHCCPPNVSEVPPIRVPDVLQKSTITGSASSIVTAHENDPSQVQNAMDEILGNEMVGLLCTQCGERIGKDGCYCMKRAISAVETMTTETAAVVNIRTSYADSDENDSTDSCTAETTIVEPNSPVRTCVMNARKPQANKLPCPLCNSYFGRAQWVGRHMKKVHGKNLREYQAETMTGRIFYCPFCQISFKNPTSFKNHSENIHGKTIKELHERSLEFGIFEKSSTNSGETSNSNVVTLRSLTNRTKFSGEGEIRSRINEAATAIFRKPNKRVTKIICQYCGCKFGSLAWLTRHLRLEHNISRGESDSQTQTKPSQALVENGLAAFTKSIKKPSEENKYICKECGAKFRNLAWLTRHRRCTFHDSDRIANEKSRKSIQLAKTPSREERRNANAEIHIKEVSKELVCQFCNYECVSDVALLAHIVAFHKERKVSKSTTGRNNQDNDNETELSNLSKRNGECNDLSKTRNIDCFSSPSTESAKTEDDVPWVPVITSVVALNDSHSVPDSDKICNAETVFPNDLIVHYNFVQQRKGNNLSKCDQAVSGLSKTSEAQWNSKFEEFIESLDSSSKSSKTIFDNGNGSESLTMSEQNEPPDRDSTSSCSEHPSSEGCANNDSQHANNNCCITDKDDSSDTATFQQSRRSAKSAIPNATRNHSKKVKYYRCSVCRFKDRNKEKITYHFAVHHSRVHNYKCGQCSFTYAKRSAFLKHMEESHKTRKKSPVYFSKKNFVLDRYNLSAENKLNDQCRTSSASPRTSHLRNPPNSCPFCPYKGKRRCHLTLHMKRHRPRAEASFKCPHCPFYVTQKKPLTDHISLHLKMRENERKMANKRNSPKRNEREDLAASKITSASYNSKPSRLEQCGPSNPKNAQSASQMPYSCEHCPFTAFTKIHYLYHKQFHRPNNNALYRCHQCCYWSNRRNEMSIHLTLHIEPPASSKVKTPGRNTDQNPLPNNNMEEQVEGNSQNRSSSTSNRKSPKKSHTGEVEVSPTSKPNQSPTKKKSQGDATVSSSVESAIYPSHHAYSFHFSHSLVTTNSRVELPVDQNLSKYEAKTYNLNETNKRSAPVSDPRRPSKAMRQTISRADYASTTLEEHSASFQFPSTDSFAQEAFLPHEETLNLSIRSSASQQGVSLHQDYENHIRVGGNKPPSAYFSRVEMQMHQPGKAPYPSNSAPDVATESAKNCMTTTSDYYYRSSSAIHAQDLSADEESEIRQQILDYPKKTGVHLFCCAICPAAFTRPAILRYHRTLHESDGIYKCQECSYAINNRARFRTHLLLHYYFSDSYEGVYHQPFTMEKQTYAADCSASTYTNAPEAASSKSHQAIFTGHENASKNGIWKSNSSSQIMSNRMSKPNYTYDTGKEDLMLPASSIHEYSEDAAHMGNVSQDKITSGLVSVEYYSGGNFLSGRETYDPILGTGSYVPCNISTEANFTDPPFLEKEDN